MARRGGSSANLFGRCLMFWWAPVLYMTCSIVKVAGSGGSQQSAVLLSIAPTLGLLLTASILGLAVSCLLRQRATVAALQLLVQLPLLLMEVGGGKASRLPLPYAPGQLQPVLVSTSALAARLPAMAPVPAPIPPAAAAPAAPSPAVVEEPDKISVVLPCLNESTFAVKTAKRFCERTPPHVLHEIVVVDDGSSPPLEEKFKKADIEERCRLRVLKHSKPYGLMIAKQTGGDAAMGRYIGFFDCHVAPQKDWYKEIITLLRAQPKRLVVPMIGDIDLDTWDERKDTALTAKCYINFNADFWWYDDESDFIPVISGGLVATTRMWWRASGGFDGGMRGWGGENTDQSLRAWLCGGDIMRAKSSRIAHMWRVQADKRTLARYRFKGQTDNLARVAAIWFDDFRFKFRSGSLDSHIDVSGPLKRSREMQCKPFVYFLHRFRRIFRDGGVLPTEVFKIQSAESGKCIHRRGDTSYGLGACPSSTQFHLANMAPKGLFVEVLEDSIPAASPDGDGAPATVTCGNHKAKSCAECPQGNGASWCHQDCAWSFGQCVPKGALKKPLSSVKKCCSGIREWNSIDCFDRPDPTGPIAYQCDVMGMNQNQQYAFDSQGRIRHTSGKCVSEGKHKNRLGMTDCDDLVTRWKKVEAFYPPETKLYHDLVARHGLTEDMPDH